MSRFLAPAPTQPVEPASRRPTFSVIIAAYQSAHLIADAVSSALAQEPAPFEVIVCDDGSTDDLPGALAPFGGQVRYLRIDHAGEAAAKNAAARAARGDYLAVLDADDVYLEGRLAAFGDLAMVRPDLDILTTDAYLTVGGETVGRAYNERHTFAVDDQPERILSGNFIFGLVAVRRGRFLAAGGYDPAIRYTTDWDCWLRMILDGSRVGLVTEPLARYRLHEGSMSARRREMAEGRCMTLAKALGRPDLQTRHRHTVESALAVERVRLEREALRAALESRAGRSTVRRLAVGVARSGRHGWRTRLKAAAAAAMPGTASRLAAEGASHTFRTVGDRELARRE